MPHRHNRWLAIIALYKLAQAALFIAIGVGAWHLLHKDVDDVLGVLADRLGFNPEARFTHFLLEKASLIDDPLLRRIGAAAFCYAGLGVAEGVGLYLEKLWGEILTLVITASFLPWEIVQVLHRITWVRLSFLSVNLCVVLYLFYVVLQKRRGRAHKSNS